MPKVSKKSMYGVLLLVLCVGGLVVMYLYSNSVERPQTSSLEKKATASTLRELIGFWEGKIREIGPAEAYASFLKTARESSLDTHEQAHAFGEALYLVEGLSGLQYCDSSFEFGCYHSFFGVAVLEKGIGVLSEFSDACRAKFGDYNLPCEHGIGHGVLVYTDYENLEQALLLCKTISDLPTGGCSSGVFMENNFHTMDETREGMFVRPDEGDLFAPCNSLKEEFQASCYLEQVQWWQSLFNSDFEHIGGLCNTLTQGTENYEACFHGIGNYLAAEAKLQVAEIVTGCARMPDASSQALCHEGASWLVRGDGTGIEDAKKVCTALMGEPEEKCLNKLR